MKERTANYFDCAFFDSKKDEMYAGRRRFEVSHPAHHSLIVAAPVEEAAIVAAADRWGEIWTNYNFYAFCDVKVRV